MVIGNGLIASQFHDYHLSADVVIFASGVSNSSNKEQSAFDREKKMLNEAIQAHPNKKLIYFSTCSIYDTAAAASLYVQHKLEMETLIKERVQRFLIIRLSNPIGRYNNPHTFFNYFVDHIQNGTAFEVWSNAERNIIDIDDFYKLTKRMINDDTYTNSTINLANPHNFKVLEIVTAIEKHFGKKGKYTVINKGERLQINTSVVEQLGAKLEIDFSTDYIHQLLQKYFSL